MHEFFQFLMQHWVTALALVLVIILLIREEAARAGTMLSAQDVSLKLNNDEAKLVDIRAINQYKDGHIAGSLNVPADVMKGQLDQLEPFKDKTIVLVCAQGMSAQKFGPVLKKAGFKDVAILKGGMRAWLNESYPTVKS